MTTPSNRNNKSKSSFHHHSRSNTIAVRQKVSPQYPPAQDLVGSHLYAVLEYFVETCSEKESACPSSSFFFSARPKETYCNFIVRLCDGLRGQAETLAPLADFVGSESQYSGNELTLGQRVSLLWLCFWFCCCFCFSCIVTRVVDCRLRESDSARQTLVSLRNTGFNGEDACHLHCLLRPIYCLGGGREVQVLVAEIRAFGSLCAEGLVDSVVLGVAGGCSLLDIACRLGEGTGSNEGQRTGQDCEEVHVGKLNNDCVVRMFGLLL